MWTYDKIELTFRISNKNKSSIQLSNSFHKDAESADAYADKEEEENVRALKIPNKNWCQNVSTFWINQSLQKRTYHKLIRMHYMFLQS